jgi:MFS family permease
VLVAMTVMISITNLLDQAYVVVLVPVWAYQSGQGVEAVGCCSPCSPRRRPQVPCWRRPPCTGCPATATYLIAFLVCGAPRFVVLAFDAPLWAVLATGAVGGFAAGFINPLLGAVIFERIPRHLVGRVSSLNTALCWAGIPFGGLVGGACVAAIGLSPALLVLGGALLRCHHAAGRAASLAHAGLAPGLGEPVEGARRRGLASGR